MYVLFGNSSALNGLVEQRCDIFLAITMSGTEHHNAVFDGQCIQVVQHNMVRFWQQCGLALPNTKKERNKIRFIDGLC